ncbi:glycosyltransferase family 4 protein [Beggiatoa leptomitoformis]|uniref:Glycosyltransferase n=1 Tax=Beggiatoa leptomitoformis TaxID=288004 RepID=A0A2N9YES7_9GAMM|nr:glycosyltransferase family 4 protein [Beggiatoa leptomitoformis]ALG68709.1 glycosyltransferase [Beggiatoa leptomitoformis]AUI68936.1 glycosyltransferase [Beggiatoa leptomitoformis]
MSKPQTVLLITLYPYHGGVLTMTEQVISFLKEAGLSVTLAYYTSYNLAPDLSVPSWQLLQKKPQYRQTTVLGDVPAYEIGVYLPELEYTRYLPSAIWLDVIQQYDYIVVVSGNILPANPAVALNKPCLAWIATPYLADKQDRAKRYAWYRRWLDTWLDTPWCLTLEKQVLQKAKTLVLSHYTAKQIQEIQPEAQLTRMPMPIDASLFFPDSHHPLQGRIGFSGRFDDPRKNIALLFAAFKLCREQGLDITLALIGAKVDKQAKLQQEAEALGIAPYIEFLDERPRHELGEFYRSLDIFVMPSHQEGLGIAALEAMACGCPIISTTCGGPEEFVKTGKNGFLVDFDPQNMARAIRILLENQLLYDSMRYYALKTIQDNYSEVSVKQIFWDAFTQTFTEQQ